VGILMSLGLIPRGCILKHENRSPFLGWRDGPYS
jgi:hypothetical protein